MPDQATHIAQAEHNWDFVKHLGPLTSPFVDWVLTGLFYAALHYVDALLASRGILDPGNHGVRLQEFANAPGIDPATYNAYRDLKDDSESARYYCLMFTNTDVQQFSHPRYLQVRQTVRRLLKI